MKKRISPVYLVVSLVATLLLWAVVMYSLFINTRQPHIIYLMFGLPALYVTLQVFSIHLKYRLICLSAWRRKVPFILRKNRLEHTLVAATIVSFAICSYGIKQMLLSKNTVRINIIIGYAQQKYRYRDEPRYTTLSYTTPGGYMIEQPLLFSGYEYGQRMVLEYSPIWPEVSRIIGPTETDISY